MATTKLYRARTGKVFGVCQGIADWRDLPVDILRAIAAIAILATGVFPGLLVYALLALFLPLEPGYGTHYGDDDDDDRPRHDRRSYRHTRSSRTQEEPRTTREDLRETFENLKRKVEGMEEEILDKERDWDQRFHEDKKQ
jgi:phage shock protein C